MKKYLIAVCVLVLISGICGFVTKKNFTDAGILSMRTIEEAENIPFRFYTIFDESSSQGFTDYEDSYVEDCEQSEYIAIVMPTGLIVENVGKLSQEAEVQKVSKGSRELEGKKIYLSSTSGLAQIEEDNNQIYYIGIKNLMQKGDRYLAFFRSIKLNEELGEEYYALDGIFSYLNMDHTNEDEIIELDKEYQLKELKNVEFFTSSENALKGMNKIKQRIIQKYGE